MKITKQQIRKIIREQSAPNDRVVYLTSEELWHTLLAMEKYNAVAHLSIEDGDAVESALKKLKAAY